MKLTIDKAVGMFNAIKQVSYKEVKLDKISLIWLRLYPLAKEWDDLQAQIRKDIDEARKPFSEEFKGLKEEERNTKGPDIERRFNEAVAALPSVKSQQAFLQEEREADIPTLTEDEFLAISRSSSFKSIGEAGILFELVAK